MAWIATSDMRSKTSSADPCPMDSVPAVHGTVMAASARRSSSGVRCVATAGNTAWVSTAIPHDVGQGRIGPWSGDHDDGVGRFDVTHRRAVRDMGIRSELINAQPEQGRHGHGVG